MNSCFCRHVVFFFNTSPGVMNGGEFSEVREKAPNDKTQAVYPCCLVLCLGKMGVGRNAMH